MNDSTALGYLAPLTAAPTYDLALAAQIQPAVVGITGMLDALVVLKGQPIPPSQPGQTQTWCAIGIADVSATVYADDVHDGAADNCAGESRLFRQEEIEVMSSFYGPAAQSMASLFRDGLSVGQNRDALSAAGLVFVRFERMSGLADLINQQFVRRVDAVIRLRRMVGRTYPIRNIESLAAVTGADGGDASSPDLVVTNVGSALAVTDPTIGN